VKANCQAMAYLALALKPMELLHLLTRSVTAEWPEGEAWKVMKQVQTSTGRTMCSRLWREGSSLQVSEWVWMKTQVYCFENLLLLSMHTLTPKVV